jgi:hypothetical protein
MNCLIDNGLISTIDLVMKFDFVTNKIKLVIKCKLYVSVLTFSFEVCGPCVV